jgi:hypothetical protein
VLYLHKSLIDVILKYVSVENQQARDVNFIINYYLYILKKRNRQPPANGFTQLLGGLMAGRG